MSEGPLTHSDIREEFAKIAELLDEAARRQAAIHRTISTLFSQGIPAWNAPVLRTDDFKKILAEKQARSERENIDLDRVIEEVITNLAVKGFPPTATGRRGIYKLNIPDIQKFPRRKIEDSIKRLLDSGRVIRLEDATIIPRSGA